jgi:hypothetical protein
MMKFVPLLCLFVISANAQTVTCTTMFNQINCSKVQTDYVSPIANAMKASAEAAQRARQLKDQQDQFQQGLQLEKEKLKLEQDRLKLEQERQHAANNKDDGAADQERVQAEISKTLQALGDKYPDFASYENKMAELMNSFLPGKTATLYGYIEGLYLIAKHEGPEKQSPVKTP